MQSQSQLVQGFGFPDSPDLQESWAFASPIARHPFLALWLGEWEVAIVMGLDDYCQKHWDCLHPTLRLPHKLPVRDPPMDTTIRERWIMMGGRGVSAGVSHRLCGVECGMQPMETASPTTTTIAGEATTIQSRRRTVHAACHVQLGFSVRRTEHCDEERGMGTPHLPPNDHAETPWRYMCWWVAGHKLRGVERQLVEEMLLQQQHSDEKEGGGGWW